MRAGLAERRVVTWPDLFGGVTEHLAGAKASFDFAVVDEAQDVGVAELRFLAALGAGRRDARIGRNELAAIRACLAYVDAQKAFHAMTEKSGPPEYAQLLASTPGRHDGLYWPSREGEPESPLAPVMAQAVEDGYPGERAAGKRVPYHGYFFRILMAQGASTPDGAPTYIANGRMTGGFALVGWPALYGASGIMSLIVNQDCSVFQKDLGPNTAWLGVTMKDYNPDMSWTSSISETTTEVQCSCCAFVDRQRSVRCTHKPRNRRSTEAKRARYLDLVAQRPARSGLRN